ncbi:MAG: glycosyltransferase family 4 protein [Lachnospiraceae bacterium]|nr:glycosyltransferase family 4 protein [Lachnospiraceae bacterium]
MAFFEVLSSYRCNAVFSPCKNNAIAFGRDCRRNVKVIETPFINDVQEYDSQFYDSCLKGKKYVLFFGSLYAEKGILVIAEILEKFLGNNPDYYFVFIGNAGSIKGESATKILQNKAGKYSDRIIISNALGHKQLYPVIDKADFVVLPSLMENLSNACIEAMYFERIVIGTDGASFEQLITHGKNGFLCRIGDSQDLLEKMQMAVLTGEDQKKEMGILARKRIDKLKPEYAVRRLTKLYKYVITNSKRK